MHVQVLTLPGIFLEAGPLWKHWSFFSLYIWVCCVLLGLSLPVLTGHTWRCISSLQELPPGSTSSTFLLTYLLSLGDFSFSYSEFSLFIERLTLNLGANSWLWLWSLAAAFSVSLSSRLCRSQAVLTLLHAHFWLLKPPPSLVSCVLTSPEAAFRP